MRVFDFDFQDQTFQAVFRLGHIYYRRDDITAYFQVEAGDVPAEVTADQGQTMLSSQKRDLFRQWHTQAQNTLFDLIRADNEID